MKTYAGTPADAFQPSVETIREWFRRTYGREPTDPEVEAVRKDLQRTGPGPPADDG